MKVIVSADSIKFPLTGIGRYTYSLINGLAGLNADTEILLQKGDSIIDANNYVPDSSNISNQIGFELTKYLKKVPFLPFVRRYYSSRKLSKRLKKYDQDIFHGTNFFLPDFPGKSVVTIHDLSIYSHPECHPRERVKYMKKAIEHSIENADRIITDSEYTKDRIIELFKLPGKRIHAIPLAVSDEYHPRSDSWVNEKLASYGLNYCLYSLYVGTIEPRKNIISMLEAYSGLDNDLKTKYPLVLVGHKGWNSEDIHQLIRQYEKEGWVRYLGYFPDEDLPYLFSGARAFIFPSLLEGFGLPVLEAMASGVPVVCSNTSSLPEVGGDAVAMCSPEDVETLSQLINSAITDEQWRNIAIEKGLRRAKEFSWKRCAKETLEVYRELSAEI